MVAVTGLNGVVFAINSDLIEHAEATPDTVITLTTGNKLVIREGLEELIDKVIAFKHAVRMGLGLGVDTTHG
ncbi:flagellar FlbD family protein [Granulicella tundricola]|uniref:Flagellar FlbD family protein n=1 Tax=Granulicella tundricola (strain ATCC BAA-1859 / DSM 23138 / MP5ACTX9) TaxID=1198114 RepID=E8X610_GRATM|nr:flagellar FlbD family protein [Granulicella tundricola]ADW70894.1 flagellar FlbD family protein [Granulicella tundricola MP5ACTX9]